jgi:hypothetical protein
VFTPATVIVLGAFAIMGGVALQRFRQSLQDRRDLKARLERNGQRVWREVRWTAFVLLIAWIAYQVVEHGGMH